MKTIKSIAVIATSSLFAASQALAQSDSSYAMPTHSGGSPFGGLIFLIFSILALVGMWKVFVKAGRAGWECIIPIYGAIVLYKIAGRPWWWVLLFIIPPVGFIFWIIVAIDLAKSFGKGVGFGVGIAFLWGIFIPILGFSDAAYKGPAGA